MVDATCDANEFIQKVDASCDTQDLIQIVDTNETKDMESFKDESQKETLQSMLTCLQVMQDQVRLLQA
jgi:hypothetical protein